MKKLTPKQRREIYLKAAEYLFERMRNGYSLDGLCVLLTNDINYRPSQAASLFPEFSLFQPDKNEYDCLWWCGDYDYNFYSRIDCMLFCAEISKTAKQ